MDQNAWVPMRWPAGLLEIARLKEAKGSTAEAVEVLRKWQDPSSLTLVEGSPINCLVVSWASGLPADAEQQQALKPLLEAGRQAQLAFVGLVDGAADKSAAVAAARSAGLSAVAMEGDAPKSAGIPVIPWTKSTQMRWGADSPVLSVTDGRWPGIPREKPLVAAPTSLPWVDSNGALLTMARALAPNKAVWIAVDPPQATVLTAEAYMLAVADAEVYGGRWVVSLDNHLQAGLAAESRQALDVWKRTIDTLTFFRQHKEAWTYQRTGLLAVMSDFAEPDRYLAEEVLNLLPRGRQPFRVITRSLALGASFTGLQAIFYADQEPPDPKLRQKLIAFVKGGGILFVPAKWPNPEGSAIPAEAYLLFGLRTLGKGRLAVAKEDEPDPSDFVAHIQIIMSHRYDPLHLYNGSSVNCLYQISPQGRQAVVHLLNYSRRREDLNAYLYMRAPFRSSRFVSPEVASPVVLELVPEEGGGVDLSVPPFAVYGAVELEQ